MIVYNLYVNKNGDRIVEGLETITNRHRAALDWGTTGMGSAELAYAILNEFVGPELAEKYHQQYKEEIISKIPNDGGSISNQEVTLWLKDNGIADNLKK